MVVGDGDATDEKVFGVIARSTDALRNKRRLINNSRRGFQVGDLSKTTTYLVFPNDMPTTLRRETICLVDAEVTLYLPICNLSTATMRL